MMDPALLPTHKGLPRVVDITLRVLLSAPLRLLWTALLLGLAQWALFRLLPSVARLPNVTLGGALRNAVLVGFVLWLSLALLEGKTLASAVGLSLRTAPSGFARGYLLGALGLSAVTAVTWLAGAYTVSGLGAGGTPRALLHAALLFLFVAVFEEVIARAILFRLLEQALGTWAALGVSALFFGFTHIGNPGSTPLSCLAIALEAGVLLAACYVATRSLWVPIGLHAAWNFFEGPIFGAPVSGLPLPSLLDAHFQGPHWLTGGAFGPEAGLPAVLMGTLLGGYFLLLARERRQFRTPRWLKRLRLWVAGLFRRDGGEAPSKVPG